MGSASYELCLLTIATAALAAWWLGLRPGATFRGIAPTLSVLIVLMAVLMSILSLDRQWNHRPGPARWAHVGHAP
jgi:hypothetical protein